MGTAFQRDRNGHRSGELADPRVVARFRALAPWVGAAMVASALLVLLGWWQGIDGLTRLLGGATAMKPSSAVTFILAGVALLACARPGVSGRWCALPNIAVALLGGLSLLEYLAGIDPGIDHLFPDPEAIALGMPAGRMSQMTAVGFVLLGGLGLLVRARRGVLLAQALAAGLLAIGALALAIAGYRYRVGEMTFVPVAAPTAILLIAAALAWLALQPPQGVMAVATADSPGGVLLRRMGLPALLLPLGLAVAVRGLETRLGWSHAEVIAALAFLSGAGMLVMVMYMARLLHGLDRQRRNAARLQDDALTDALTRLPNRRAFDTALERLLAGHRQSDVGFALLMVDLDRFKSYNDDYGHLVGDEALRRTGAVLRGVLRPQDLAARYGGEEFAVLLPATSAIGARRVATRLREGFHAQAWPERPLTASIGIAWAQPGDSAASLISRADAALYQAKEGGRDRACEALPSAMSQMV
ncbi:MAG TPA: GGDEF domain-containing protein [Thermomonas sp.]|jgi:diguanylate cyclase (GGDEF)-like protein|nr:GGDEF domain-containing protein [Thermomonas sp.]